MMAFLFGLPFASHAGVAARVSECGSNSNSSCNQTLTIRTLPEAGEGEVSLFVAIVGMRNGAPNLAQSGWFNGREWRTGDPVPAWTGQLVERQAVIPLYGGICGLVQQVGRPAGDYTLFVGWGRTKPQQSGGIDEREIEQIASEASDPQSAQQLRKLAAEYRAAQERIRRYDGGSAYAMTDMRVRNNYQQIQSVTCGGKR